MGGGQDDPDSRRIQGGQGACTLVSRQQSKRLPHPVARRVQKQRTQLQEVGTGTGIESRSISLALLIVLCSLSPLFSDDSGAVPASVQPHSASTPPAAQLTHLICSSPLVSGSYQNTYWLFTLHAHIQSYQESSTRYPLLASPSYPISASSRRKSTSESRNHHPNLASLHSMISTFPSPLSPRAAYDLNNYNLSIGSLARMRNVDSAQNGRRCASTCDAGDAVKPAHIDADLMCGAALHSARRLHTKPRDPALVPPRQQSASTDRTFTKLATSADVLVCWCCGAASVPPGGDCAHLGLGGSAGARDSAWVWCPCGSRTRRTKRAPCRRSDAHRVLIF
ncbi:hypothetical protein C8J57DRAFT_1730310 [Mycena rebaudengoi]|nr:hypothetical protein C8J57DRAFT_1730310 [Mycena rebaudengoi]